MARRMIIEGGGLPKHPQPFPTAVKVGNLVCSSFAALRLTSSRCQAPASSVADRAS